MRMPSSFLYAKGHLLTVFGSFVLGFVPSLLAYLYALKTNQDFAQVFEVFLPNEFLAWWSALIAGLTVLFSVKKKKFPSSFIYEICSIGRSVLQYYFGVIIFVLMYTSLVECSKLQTYMVPGIIKLYTIAIVCYLSSVHSYYKCKNPK